MSQTKWPASRHMNAPAPKLVVMTRRFARLLVKVRLLDRSIVGRKTPRD